METPQLSEMYLYVNHDSEIMLQLILLNLLDQSFIDQPWLCYASFSKSHNMSNVLYSSPCLSRSSGKLLCIASRDMYSLSTTLVSIQAQLGR